MKELSFLKVGLILIVFLMQFVFVSEVKAQEEEEDSKSTKVYVEGELKTVKKRGLVDREFKKNVNNRKYNYKSEKIVSKLKKADLKKKKIDSLKAKRERERKVKAKYTERSIIKKRTANKLTEIGKIDYYDNQEKRLNNVEEAKEVIKSLDYVPDGGYKIDLSSKKIPKMTDEQIKKAEEKKLRERKKREKDKKLDSIRKLKPKK